MRESKIQAGRLSKPPEYVTFILNMKEEKPVQEPEVKKENADPMRQCVLSPMVGGK